MLSIDGHLSKVNDYYSEKITQHGPTARGVDWNSEQSQSLRFDQLSTVFGDNRKFSLVDFGCGYGAYATYLIERGCDVRYLGYDFSASMILAARNALSNMPGVEFTAHVEDLVPADYVVASGLMNVKLDCPAAEWRRYILAMLDQFNALSTCGYSFNVLSKYSDADRMRPDLYYADPCELLDYCKRHHSRFVAVLHDYPLYEFTVLVKK